MKTKTFNKGEEVYLKCDRNNRYRYVHNNVVQNIETGMLRSVKRINIRRCENLSTKIVFAVILITLLSCAAKIFHGLYF